MLTLGDWPILDYDDDPDDLVSRLSQSKPEERLPERAVLAVLGQQVLAHAQAERLRQVGVVDFVTARYPIYQIERAGRRVALVEAPIGAAAAVMVGEFLRQRGVRSAVAVGSCGALRPFDEGVFITPVRALRAEGVSHHYLPPGEWVETDAAVRAACLSAIRGRGHEGVQADTWTTDGFYRETPALLAHRIAQGCSVVEMECAAWAAWALFRGVRFGQILFTADSLAGETYDARDWGVGSHEVALRMAIDAAFGLED